MAVILEDFIINNFHILSYLILMYCHNLRAKEIHCEFDRKKTKNTHFNLTRYKHKTNQYGVRLRWYLIKGRASPACYWRGFCWDPTPFGLYYKNPLENAFLALLGVLQVLLCPLEPG